MMTIEQRTSPTSGACQMATPRPCKRSYAPAMAKACWPLHLIHQKGQRQSIGSSGKALARDLRATRLLRTFSFQVHNLVNRRDESLTKVALGQLEPANHQ